jgi:hypothetical protein
MDTQLGQGPGLGRKRDEGSQEPLAPPAAAGRPEVRSLPAESPPDSVELLRRIFAPGLRPEPSSLDGCKKAARALTEADRRHFAQWVSRGMRD